jgi:hypothetical protein
MAWATATSVRMRHREGDSPSALRATRAARSAPPGGRSRTHWR